MVWRDFLPTLIKKPAQFEAVLRGLKSVLGSDDHYALAELAKYICREESAEPLPDLLRKLFREGHGVAQILAALLKCESVLMQMLFSGHAAMPFHTQFNDLKQIVHGFNNIQDAVLEIGENYLVESEAKNIQGSSERPGERISSDNGISEVELKVLRERVLLASMKEWKKKKKVHIYNTFRGIPVNATANVLAVGDKSLSIALDKEVGRVFASHPQKDSAYLVCSDGDEQIEISVEKVGHGEVMLKLGGVSPSYLGRRDHLEVRLSENVPVEFWQGAKKLGAGILVDASVSGLGFVLKESDKLPYSTGDELECRFIIGNREIRAIGWIRWVLTHEGTVRTGMELRKDKVVQEALQREIFRVQRQIIVAMNELEIPEAFREFL